ncbi:MAG: DUF2325 domain-containing protein [Desulfovibrionales bacterium]|nr:DUF2325 domain-containing protein [Desulfovibrionales bacterium]
MCATLIGGMDRLKRDYINTAKSKGVKLKVFTGKENSISGKMGTPDMVILFTNKVSHAARREVVQYAKAKDIPLHMAHSCGVSTLKQVLR